MISIDLVMFLVVLGEVFETCVGGRVVAREIRHGTRENQLQCLGEVLHGELADAALEGLVLFGVGLLPGVEFLEHRGHRQRRVTLP